MEKDPYIASFRFRRRDPMASSRIFTTRSAAPIVTDAVFSVSVPSVAFTGFVNSALLNDDPTRIYSAAWYAEHGIKVLRHDRKGVSEREFPVHDFIDILKKMR